MLMLVLRERLHTNGGLGVSEIGKRIWNGRQSAAQIPMDGVALDGEFAAGDVFVPEVVELATPFGIRARDRPRRWAGLPDASNQIQSKHRSARRSISASGISSSVALPPQHARQRGQPHAGVDFV
jgi:hypothetical protein